VLPHQKTYSLSHRLVSVPQKGTLLFGGDFGLEVKT
jgi:hypothetical protein